MQKMENKMDKLLDKKKETEHVALWPMVWLLDDEENADVYLLIK